MKKNELWAHYVAHNPEFMTSGARFTPDGLWKFFEVTYDTAHKRGVMNGRAIESELRDKQENKTDSNLIDFMAGFMKEGR
jgi:hypothetical protein